MKPVIVMTQTSEYLSDQLEIKHKPFIKLQELDFDLNVLNHNYDWIIFTSKNAVQIFYPYLKKMKFSHIAVIGVKTAEYCKKLNIQIDLIPNDYSQEGLLEKFNYKNCHILIPSSEKARPLLANKLSNHNMVDKIDLYRPIAHEENIKQVHSWISQNKIDAITFSSSSAVKYFFEYQKPEQFNSYFAIGKQTLQSIESYGYKAKLANNQTLESLESKILESRENDEI